MKYKYANKRIDRLADNSEHQQTTRFIFPMVAFWMDESRIGRVAICFGWWRWTVHFFFNVSTGGAVK